MLSLSAVVSVQRSGFDALPFQNVDLGEMCPVIRDLGCDAIELAVRDPFSLEIRRVQGAVNGSRLRLSALGTGQAYVDEGMSLSARDISLYQKAVERLKDHIALAALFPGCRVIVGSIRGRLGEWGCDREKGIIQFQEAMRELADIAYDKCVDLLIEPINHYETDFINGVDECLAQMERIGAPNVKVLADTFHMNIEESDCAQAIKRCGAHLGHVHLADSNRRTPGMGHYDFHTLMRSLRAIDYWGDLAFEIIPGSDPLKALGEGIAYITRVAAEAAHETDTLPI